MTRPKHAALLLAAVALAALGLPALAVPPTGATPTAIPGVLSAARPVSTWTGHMHNPAPVPMASNPDPTVCAVLCQLWSLRVATRSRFLVSLHNGTDSIEDGFNLYVYDPAGNQVAAANGIGANGQAVAVQPAAQGVYTVAVTMTYAYDTDATYLGEARLMTGRTWEQAHCLTAKPCPVLPALRALPPSDVHVDGVPPVASTPLGFPLPVDAPLGNSCYLDETAATGAMRCLRFTSEVDNVGAGTLQLQIPWVTSAGKNGFLPGQCEAQQVVTWSDGSTRVRPAGPCEYHPQHAHFHYKDYVEFSLHAVNRDGTEGKRVAASLKESFCLADDGYFGFRTAGPNGPRRYVGQPDCNVPGLSTSSLDAIITMGNSPGWGDIYTWDTPSQYIDITATPAGTYDIVAQANPASALLLSGVTKSCAATRIKLTATEVTVLRSGVPCS
jgi:hypothetical protein